MYHGSRRRCIGGWGVSEPARLWNRNYALLWQGQFVSQLGSQAFFIGMAFWIKDQTGSATVMGLIMMASQIPAILLSPIAGAFADNHPRKRIIVTCDLINGLLTITLAAVFILAPEQAGWHIVALFFVTVLVSSVSAFFRPAVSAAIPDIVPRDRLNAANSFHQGSLQISSLAGLSAGGVLYRVLGAPVLFLVDGISYLASAVSESFMKIPHTPPRQPQSGASAWERLWRDVKAGFLYIWNRAGMRNLLIAAAGINFFSMPYLVLMPFFVEDTLGGTPDWYGYILASFSAGVLGGYLLAAAANISGRVRSALMVGALLLMTALFSLMSAAPDVLTALVIMFATGMASGFFNINLQTLFQVTTPAHMRGRVFSLLATVAQGLMPVGMAMAGVVADLLDQNIRLVFAGTGAITLLLAAAISLSREYRDYLAQDDAVASQG